MKLFIESLMIFFGTLLTAALVALGEPAHAELAMAQAVIEQAQSAPEPTALSGPPRAPDAR